MNDRIRGVVEGAAAGLIGTIVLQGLRTSSASALPGTMPPIETEPGEFMVRKAEMLLPKEIRSRVPTLVEAVAGRSLAAGYGVTAGALYGVLGPRNGSTVLNGTVLVLGTWAAGYLGWLPAMGLMAPIAEQDLPQVAGPVVRHVLFGIATVAVFQWLRARDS